MKPRTAASAALLLVVAALSMPAAAGEAVATFAGGSFRSSAADFEKVDGVTGVVAGYSGGAVDKPSSGEVAAGGTGHVEAVEIRYDPLRVSYEHLLEVYWNSIDPYARNTAFCDHGAQYQSAVFYHDAAQRAAAERSRDALAARYPVRPPIVTRILPASRFWPAEAEYQGYARQHPLRYRYARWRCGRDQLLDELWGKERIRK